MEATPVSVRHLEFLLHMEQTHQYSWWCAKQAIEQQEGRVRHARTSGNSDCHYSFSFAAKGYYCELGDHTAKGVKLECQQLDYSKRREKQCHKRWELANDDFMEEVVRFCLYGLQ